MVRVHLSGLCKSHLVVSSTLTLRHDENSGRWETQEGFLTEGKDEQSAGDLGLTLSPIRLAGLWRLPYKQKQPGFESLIGDY